MTSVESLTLVPGGYPGEGAVEAMEALHEDTAETLFAITDGETDPDQESWVVEYCRKIQQHLDLPLYGEQDGYRYWHYWRRLAKNWVNRKEIKRRVAERGLPELGIARRARQNYATFKKLRENGGPEHFIVGVPTPFAFAFFSGIVFCIDELTQQVIEELKEIIDDSKIDNEDLVFSFELPAENTFGTLMHLAPAGMIKKLARKSLKSVLKVINSLPSEVMIMAHLCGGDLGRKRLLPWHSLRAFVAFGNVFLRVIPRRFERVCLHLPLAAGQHLPTVNRLRLRALRKLRPVQSGTLVAFGIGHKSQSALRVLKLKRRVVKATPQLSSGQRLWASLCGLRRHTAEQAKHVCQQLIVGE